MLATPPLPLDLRIPAHEPRHPDFWRRDLRLGRYDEIHRDVADPAYCHQRLAAWFRTRRALRPDWRTP